MANQKMRRFIWKHRKWYDAYKTKKIDFLYPFHPLDLSSDLRVRVTIVQIEKSVLMKVILDGPFFESGQPNISPEAIESHHSFMQIFESRNHQTYS